MIYAIVKLGGSIITLKDRPFKADKLTIDRLAKELAQAGKKLMVVHGGGSYGHTVVLKYGVGVRTSREKLGSSKAKLAMQELNTLVSCSLLRHGLLPYSLPPSCIFSISNGVITKAHVKVIKKLAKLGFTPLSYGDIVIDDKRGFSVLSGDEIVCFLAKLMKVKRVVFCLDVDGVYDDDPKKNPSAKLLTSLSYDQVEKLVSSMPPGHDATKGMLGKLSSLLKLKSLGIKVFIINGRREGLLREALIGNPSPATVIY